MWSTHPVRACRYVPVAVMCIFKLAWRLCSDRIAADIYHVLHLRRRYTIICFRLFLICSVCSVDVVRELSVVEGYDDDQSCRVPSLRVQVMLTAQLCCQIQRRGKRPKELMEVENKGNFIHFLMGVLRQRIKSFTYYTCQNCCLYDSFRKSKLIIFQK